MCPRLLLPFLFAALSFTFTLSLATGHPYHSRLSPEFFSPLIVQKLLATSQHTPGVSTSYPQYTTRDTGAWKYFPADTWTSGFLPATFYALAERATICPPSMNGTTAAQWLEIGRSSATGEIPLELHTGVGHDVGFLSFPFVDELTINPLNDTALHAVETFADALAARFNSVVGCTRSWDTADPTDFPVIIDNMMNLEVLFVAAHLTGNDTLRQIAVSHADKTIANHVRADGSSFHVVDYNTTTGAVIAQHTVQGYSNSSTWSRGQAWGIYGFANMYRRTQLDRYLDTARRMAGYFLNNIPEDGIIPWDFNAPLVPPRPADSSAAMIAANGLLLLAQQEQTLTPANWSGAWNYINAAIKILNDTTNAFWAPTWQSLLSNATVNNPASPPNNLTGTVYGDYYFIKAGNEIAKLSVDCICTASEA
ncbi:d-4,5 unsaturated-glucuronyl hydrolase-like protein [Multifurca ochricompacta]|uniref:D-4,5 unsaturated-glucuronyl hydrolase-like protein n=1 Tax=Multifurca ochricompacta TaxID=376703 RepID=A0AAD4M803_9AGAM|nr:d-4,5 unsaturated-glucuronyl hydrolase-like protein [Multifurca ochricompacta]